VQRRLGWRRRAPARAAPSITRVLSYINANTRFGFFNHGWATGCGWGVAAAFTITPTTVSSLRTTGQGRRGWRGRSRGRWRQRGQRCHLARSGVGICAMAEPAAMHGGAVANEAGHLHRRRLCFIQATTRQPPATAAWVETPAAALDWISTASWSPVSWAAMARGRQRR